MARFRKKPVVIDAVLFDGTPAGANAVFDEFDIPGAKFVPDADLAHGKLLVPTLEGDHTASAGDWIIRGVKGEYYPCKPDIFAATHEPDDSSPSWSSVQVGDHIVAALTDDTWRAGSVLETCAAFAVVLLDNGGGQFTVHFRDARLIVHDFRHRVHKYSGGASGAALGAQSTHGTSTTPAHVTTVRRDDESPPEPAGVVDPEVAGLRALCHELLMALGRTRDQTTQDWARLAERWTTVSRPRMTRSPR